MPIYLREFIIKKMEARSVVIEKTTKNLWNRFVNYIFNKIKIGEAWNINFSESNSGPFYLNLKQISCVGWLLIPNEEEERSVFIELKDWGLEKKYGQSQWKLENKKIYIILINVTFLLLKKKKNSLDEFYLWSK